MSFEPLHIQARIGTWDAADDKILREDDITTPTDNESFFDPALDGVFLVADELTALLAKYGGDEPVEPAQEPCPDEIPWSDLVYWLGNAATGQVECPCATCVGHETDGRHVYVPSSVFRRLRAKIPVIAIPRIEGVN